MLIVVDDEWLAARAQLDVWAVRKRLIEMDVRPSAILKPAGTLLYEDLKVAEIVDAIQSADESDHETI